MLLTEKTRQEELQKKRNIFGLGVTSLIVACSAATDTDNDTAAVGIGTIPTANLTPDELTTRDVNNDGITATVKPSLMDENIVGRPIGSKGIEISISLARNLALNGPEATLVFRIHNGSHTGEDYGRAELVSASLYTVAETGKYDLVVSSRDFGTVAGDVLTGGVYIYWNMADAIGSAIGPIVTTNHLEVKGLPGNGAIAQDAPAFFQLGGSASEQYDMVVRSDVATGTGAIYVLWDVAAYAGADKTATPKTVDFATPTSATHGLLAIKGASAGDNIGRSAPEFLKINNNNDYDMIIKADAGMYILWDVVKYYSKNAPADISLTDASAVNGLLTIGGAGDFNILKNLNGSFPDIDGKGINDIVLTGGGDTFILLGEQLAYRDTKGKAVSDTVDIAEVNAASTDAGFFTYDEVVTPTTEAEFADVIGYRFAGVLPGLDDDIQTLKDGYKTAVADLNLPDALSDADAGVGVWDIA